MSENTIRTEASLKIDMGLSEANKNESNKQGMLIYLSLKFSSFLKIFHLKDLNKILPRLAKRISSTSSPSAFASASTENDTSMKMDSVDENLQV
jgi:hypothetical protein